MGPWWLTWHLCLYICEKCEMSRLWHTNGRTHEQWKVGQYSVWAESAKTAVGQNIPAKAKNYINNATFTADIFCLISQSKKNMPAKAKNQEWRHTHRQFHFWGQNFAKTKSVFLSLPAMSFQVSQGTWSHWNCVLCRLRWMALCSLSLRWKSSQHSQHNIAVCGCLRSRWRSQRRRDYFNCAVYARGNN